MAEDRSLQWNARIDLSKFTLDAKNIDKILSQLGANGIDSTALEATIKEVGQTAVKVQKEVAQEVAQAQSKMNASLVQEAQKAQKEIQGKGVTTILPDGFVQTEKAKIEKVVDFSKEQLKELQSVVNQYGMSAIQTKGKNIERPTRGPSSNLNAILSESMQQTLSAAKTAFASLDEETKQYVLDLVDMQTALSQAESAQKRLSAAFAAGKIDQKEYTQATAALKKAQEEIRAEIKNQTAVQETSLNLQNLQTNTLKEKKAALAALKTAYSNLTDAERADSEIGGQMRNQIADLTTQIKEQSQVVTKGVNIITEYRQLRNKIASDQSAGIFNQDDIARATLLEHSIQNVNKQIKLQASNTKVFDALSQGVQGLVGAFTAASGVIGLFTDDNEKAQQIIKVTTSAMATLMGVQQLAQVLNKDSAVNVYVRNLLAKNAAIKSGTTAQTAGNVATVENTAAENANIVTKEAEIAVTEGATAAQWSLNAAMEANPVGVVLIAITAVIGAFALFTSGADKATKAQERLNDVLKKSADYLNQVSNLQKSISDDRVNAAQHALDIAKAEGKSRQEILQLQQNVNDLTKQGALEQLKINGVDPSQDIYVQVLKARQEAAKATAKATDYFNQNTKDLTNKNLTVDKEAAQKDQKILDDHAAFLNSKADKLNQFYNEYVNSQSKGESDIAAFSKESQERALSSDTDYWKAKVTIAKEGSKDWLNAQLKLNQAQYNNTVSNPNVTSGQISLAQATKLKADRDAQVKYNDQKLKDQADAIQAQLDNVKQGSAEELQLKLQLLDNQKKAEINSAKNNAALIEKINADSLKKQDDLKKTYEKDQVDRLLELQQNFAKEQLANLSPDSDSFLAFTKQLQNLQGQSQTKTALDAAAKSNPAINPKLVQDALNINGENYEDYAKKIENIDSDLAQKIRTIWAETNNKNAQSDNSFTNNLLRNANRIADIKADIAKEKNNAVLNNPNSSNFDIANANLSNNKIDQQRQEDYLKNLENTYSSAKDIISKFVSDVQADYGKIKDLSDNDSNISKALDGLKDPEAKKNLEAILIKLHDLNLSAEELQKRKISAVFEGLSQIGSEISSIGQSISSLNESLGDTLDTMGSLVSAGAELGASIASGNATGIVSSSLGLIGSIFSMFSKAKESAIKAQKELLDAQDQMNIGQIQYNQYLREQMNIQDGIVKGTLAELAAQRDLIKTKQQGNKNDLEDYKRFLITTGQQITGRHKEKYGGVFGIGKKTKVVEEYGDLGINGSMTDQQIADYLKMLELTGELDDRTKKYADAFIQANDEAVALGSTLEDLNEQIAETFAGSTSDSIAQSIVDGLKAGKRSFEDFSDDINTILSNSIFASIKDSLISGPVKKIMDQFLSDFNQNDGGMLTADEIQVLQSQLKDAIAYGTQAYDAAMQAFPELNQASDQSSALSGQIKGITQDQASELGGLFRNNLDQTKNIVSQVKISNDYLVQNMNYLKNIEKNTKDTADNVAVTNKKLDQVINNTKSQSLRDIGGVS